MYKVSSVSAFAMRNTLDWKTRKTGRHVTPETAISFTKFSVALICTWPPSPRTTRNQRRMFNVCWYASFASSILLLLPLMNGVYEYSHDPIILGKTVCLCCAVTQVTVKMLVCRWQQKRFQRLNYEMENFCRSANPSDRNVLQHYVDKYKIYHIIYVFCCYLTTFFVISGPLYLPQTFPTHAVYPFKVNNLFLKIMVYFHQSFVGFQASAGMAIDGQIALLLRYAAARFHILIMKLETVNDERRLDDCIKVHDDLLRYTREINKSIVFLVFTTVTTTTTALIFGSLNLVTNQPLSLKALYFFVVFSASIELFMCAWPADNLIRMCEKIADGAFSSNWHTMSAKLRRKVVYVISRAQKPETIRINGIMPSLSLSYYAHYLYSSFSYFTALRVMVDKSDTN